MPAVDVLFVVDNSMTMAAEQAQIRAEITSFITALRDPVHGLPDLHVGVTSADLGAGSQLIIHCEDSDEGHLLTGSCANPQGAPYIEDLTPTGCNITRDAGGQCTQHDCDQSHCGTGTFAVDSATGCPRCRNYTGEELEDVFDCISDLGILGCGFEQPLEAMRLALDPATTANSGFLRPDSILAVLFLTDEDDCSASDPYLFDPSQNDMSSPLGPFTSFRCFEFGITCDINSRTHQGVRHNCMPRTDPGALLYYIDRYATFLTGLRDPGHLVLAAIAGPVNNQEVTVGEDEYSQPEVQYSCTQGSDGGVPGIRLLALLEQFNDPVDMSWAYSSICAATYTTALESMAQEIRQRMQ
jgi:hypothetical protein